MHPSISVCNDGTPAGYYFNKGSGDGENVWLIHLALGWWCYDEGSCARRVSLYPMRISSNGWPANITLRGSFSDDYKKNPLFHNANQVYVPYCSSDSWTGNRGPIGTVGTDSWSFRGALIVQTLMEDLVTFHNLNESSEILFAGCSAGALGVMMNIDRVKAALPFQPKKFLGFSDGGWMTDVEFLKPLSFFSQFVKGIQLWNGLPNDLCATAHPHNTYLCYLGSVVMPYIETPTLIQMEQIDTATQTIPSGHEPYNNSVWLSHVRRTILASFGAIRPPHVLYSANCYLHCLSLEDIFHGIEVEETSLSEYLVDFWEGTNEVAKLIDSCPSTNCSIGCTSYYLPNDDVINH